MSADAIHALWKEYCDHHLQPSRLLPIAIGLIAPTREDVKHLEQCERCRTAFDRYATDRVNNTRVPSTNTNGNGKLPSKRAHKRA